MSKYLVIVESPAKAKTINKYLGKDFIVKSSVGHIRDLPKTGTSNGERAKAISLKGKSEAEKQKIKKQKEQAALVKRMGIDPFNDWKAQYHIIPGKEKIVKELKSLAKKAEHIYLATDLDREGEAIAWHLQEVIGSKKENYSRVVFNEITKNAITKAFENPTELNIDSVNAQQTRRFLDRIVGFMVSPLLWKKVARGLSAGRVQSVAVKLLVEREREIKAFNPIEYWEVQTENKSGKKKITLDLTHHKGKKITINNEEQAVKIQQDLTTSSFIVNEVETKPTVSRAKPPFITSTLQQSASSSLGFGVKKTMMLAQRLYEAGFITYMRTDSTNLSSDALTMVRNFISNQYGDKYLPKKPKFYSSKQNAQEAHEAIRPSNIDITGKDLKGIDRDGVRLYQLIYNRFVACQMNDALFNSTSINVKAQDYELKAKGRVLVFDGWTKVLGADNKDEILPEVKVGEILALQAVNPSQHFTKPPTRFSEATLVKELEKRAIGRPSTYASIISTIQDRGYVRLENKRFYAEKMGEIVTDRLNQSFAALMDYDFTATMEQSLDDIAKGEKIWKDQLNVFFNGFEKSLEIAAKDESDGGMAQNHLVETEIHCPDCSRNMAIRTAQTGVFLGCSGYALPVKERCKKTLNLIPEENIVNLLDETDDLRSRKRCPICEMAMDSYLVDSDQKLHICGNNPNCSGVIVEQGNFKIKGYDGPVIECDKCDGEMQLKDGRFGPYMACNDCSNTRKILKNGDVAPPREDPIALPEIKCEKSDAYFVLRDGASGIFMAAHNFPKSRESRSPKVKELVEFKDRLHSKWLYLTKAPVTDPDGNDAVVRFSRKMKKQYITSEKNGKATKWILDYIDDQWKERKK